MKRSLKDKVVWITGAGSGIGQNAAITLSNLGMKVILSGRDEKKLEITSNQCVNNTIIKPLDVSDNDKVESVSESIITEFKKIDILINSAGTNVEHRDWDVINKSDWDNIFNTNVNGLFYCCKSTLPHMKKEKDGQQWAMMDAMLDMNGNRVDHSAGFQQGKGGMPKKNPYEMDIKGEKENISWL